MFDYNAGVTTPNQGFYSFFRNEIGPRFGSSSKDPNDGKYNFKINLGNPEDW